MSTIARALRSASLLLALLSAVVLGSASESACEMHGLGAMHATAAPTAHHGASHSRSSGHQHHGGGQECCCIGDCSAPVVVASAPVTPTLLVAFVAAQPRRIFDERSAQAAPPEPERLLPFANGPPAERQL